MISKVKSVFLHEVLCRHFAVRAEECHDWPGDGILISFELGWSWV